MSFAAPQRTWKSAGSWGLCTLGLIIFFAGCGDKSDDTAEGTKPKFEVAGDGDSDDSPVVQGDSTAGKASKGGMIDQPPSLAVDDLEQITVPDGTPDELLAFADEQGQKILNLQPAPGMRPDEATVARQIALFQAIIAASDKVLTDSRSATVVQRLSAIDKKSGAMSVLSQLQQDKDWSGAVRQFGAELAADSEPEIAVIGKAILFGTALGAFQRQVTRDPEPVMAQLRDLLKDEERGDAVMGVSLQAMKALRDLGHEVQAREVLDLIIEAFKDSDDPGLAGESRRLAEEALFLDTEIEVAFNGMVSGRQGAEAEFLAALQKILSQTAPGSLTLERGVRYIITMQEAGRYPLVRTLCQMYQNAYANSADAPLKNGAATLTQMAVRRMDLIGKPLTVEGLRTDGTSLDFGQYQGKPVLLVFFAAYSPQCQQEMINYKAAYQKYHPQGLELITVSVDPNPQLLQQYLAQAQLPWVTVASNELAAQCGADMLPLGILLDRTGTVVDIFVQGQSLESKIEKVLGNTGTAKPPAAPGPGNGQSRRGVLRPIRSHSSAFVGTWVSTFDEVPDESVQEAQEEEDELVLDEEEEATNPYLAREGLTPDKLVNFLFDMQDKPTSIRRRPGFAAAIVDAADRILQSETKDKFKRIAIDAKLDILHESACLGDEPADQQLQTFVAALKSEAKPELAQRIEFFLLERHTLDVDEMELDKVPALLAELQKFFEGQAELDKVHLRLASATVHAINRLEDGDVREEHFSRFGELFAKSDDRQLARYGKKLAKGGKGRASDLIGKPLELAGMTDLGVPFDWESYRGKIVLVDFWATWCGPCLREMPHVQALHEELSGGEFDIVAISLDDDLEALAKFLAENKVPWANLIGEEAKELATKYEVRGIPTMVLVDRQGQVVAVANKVDTLKPQIKKLLEAAE